MINVCSSSSIAGLPCKKFNCMLIPVLLSGGVGSRLWPVSRAARPKQFLSLGGEGSMLQETYRRLEGLDCAAAMVVCNAEHRFMVAEQLLSLIHI